MDAYLQHKQDLLHIFSDLIAFAQTQVGDAATLVRRLREVVEHVEQERLLVAICGEFKQGKSSLINAFLEEPTLLPIDRDIATNALSFISFSSQEKYMAVLSEGGKEVTRRIQRHEIADYVSEQRNTRNVKQVRLLSIELPNAQLQKGLMLIDTPGISGLRSDLSDIAYTVLPQADIVFFVSDASSPLLAQELKFVQRIAHHCRYILHVVTKIDLESNYETILETNRERLAAALSRPKNDVQIIPVSSRVKLSYLQSKDPEDLAASNFPELEETLWNLLSQRVQIILNQGLLRLNLAIMEMKAPIEAERQTLLYNSEAEQQHLMDAWNTEHQRLQKLASKESEWRNRFEHNMKHIREQASRQLQQAFLEIERDFALDLDTPGLVDTPTEIYVRLKQNIYEAVLVQNEELQHRIEELYEQTIQDTDLNLRTILTPTLDYSSGSSFYAARLSIQRKTSWEKISDSLPKAAERAKSSGKKGASLGKQVGKAVDSVLPYVQKLPHTDFLKPFAQKKDAGENLGSVVFGALGGALGFATSFTEALQKIHTQDLEEARAKIREILEPLLTESSASYQKALQEAVQQAEAVLLKEFLEQIQHEKEVCERTLLVMEGSHVRSKKDADVRLVTLQQVLQEIEGLEKRAEQLTSLISTN